MTDIPTWTNRSRARRTLRLELAAPAGAVFPLLCPVREYEWIEEWNCGMIHSASGVAEEDCVFMTQRADGTVDTWTVSHYEPPCRIEFVKAHPKLVSQLKLRVEATSPQTCTLDWTFILTDL